MRENRSKKQSGPTEVVFALGAIASTVCSIFVQSEDWDILYQPDHTAIT